MKTFSERNPLIVGGIGIAVTAAVLAAALNYSQLPLLSTDNTYSAYFSDAAGLKDDALVQVSGVKAGQVVGIRLEGDKVLVQFRVSDSIRLGERSEAAIKNETLLGTKVVQVTPKGTGHLTQTIPLDRTISPYQLPDALGDLTATISGLDTPQLSDSLDTLAQTFQNTPDSLRIAVQGVARLSKTLNSRDEQLRNLLTNANKVTSVLAQRSDQVVSLVADTNAMLAELRTQSGALDEISNNLTSLSSQVSGLVADNKQRLRPALERLSGVLAIVDNHKQEVQKSIKLLNSYAMSLGESVSSGPFFHAYLSNLIPGQFLQPFIDAAFSDLGLDPHVLLPSERIDPPVGQPATPPLPVPFPRTGQGGEPHLTLPDAITGNPADPRYPYREPLPAPPPGGPPPGPPAPAEQYVPEPTPSPVYETPPNEPPTPKPLSPDLPSASVESEPSR
ncbi:MCE family protein [Mycobacterium sp. NPDC051198]